MKVAREQQLVSLANHSSTVVPAKQHSTTITTTTTNEETTVPKHGHSVRWLRLLRAVFDLLESALKTSVPSGTNADLFRYFVSQRVFGSCYNVL